MLDALDRDIIRYITEESASTAAPVPRAAVCRRFRCTDSALIRLRKDGYLFGKRELGPTVAGLRQCDGQQATTDRRDVRYLRARLRGLEETFANKVVGVGSIADELQLEHRWVRRVLMILIESVPGLGRVTARTHTGAPAHVLLTSKIWSRERAAPATRPHRSPTLKGRVAKEFEIVLRQDGDARMPTLVQRAAAESKRVELPPGGPEKPANPSCVMVLDGTRVAQQTASDAATIARMTVWGAAYRFKPGHGAPAK